MKVVVSNLNLQKSIKFGVKHNGITSSLMMNLSLISLEMMGKITFRERQAKSYQLESRYTKKTVKFGGGSVMVWGMMSSAGVVRLSESMEQLMLVCTKRYSFNMLLPV